MRPISRRALLRGASGVALALPTLEAMLTGNGRSYAADGAPLPNRYVVAFGGYTLGCDYVVGPGRAPDLEVLPDNTGSGYDLKRAFAPFASYGMVRDEISIVSGLRIASALPGESDDMIPPGGKHSYYHDHQVGPLLTGVRGLSYPHFVRGDSSDQIAAQVLAGGTRFPSFACNVQPIVYYVDGEAGIKLHNRRLSYRGLDQSGNAIPITPYTSPQLAFRALFGATVVTNPAEVEKQARALAARKSVLDFVGESTRRLIGRVGAADRRRLSTHLEQIRELERRVAAITPPQTSTCAPVDPGADPALGEVSVYDPNTSNTGETAHWSDEESRARAFCDLVHMAIACDQTRVVTMMLSHFSSTMNLRPILGTKLRAAAEIHGLSHGTVPGTYAQPAELAEGIAWHMKHFAYLVAKLRDTPEGDARLIDRTALVFLNEGGHGPGEGQTAATSHSTENMAALIAGRVGGLKPGQHVKAAGKHPANVLISAMSAVGVAGETLGEVSGRIPELFS